MELTSQSRMSNPHDTSSPSTEHREFARVALAYHHLGIPVIPICPPDHKGMSSGHLAKCSNPGKTPLVSDWPKYGHLLPSPTDIRHWAQRWPDANFGGPTGPLFGIALDIDPRHGGDQELESRGWKVPETPTSLPGGDGVHNIFLHPGYSVPNKVAIAPGIDFRGDGGQIVLPPSLHVSGNQYQWEPSLLIGQVPLAPAPEWLLAALKSTPPTKSAVWDERELDSTVRGVPQGQRDSTGYRLACRWLAKGFTPLEVDHFLQSWAGRCQPPIGSAPGDPWRSGLPYRGHSGRRRLPKTRRRPLASSHNRVLVQRFNQLVAGHRHGPGDCLR